MIRKDYYERLVSIKNEKEFEDLALEVFRFQSLHNKVYSKFLSNLKISIEEIKNVNEIPFLPVEFFKSSKILSGDDNYQIVFTSSGTTGEQVSSHYVKDSVLYEKVFTEIFSATYGSIKDYVLLALLPSYLEREGSSLIYMVKKLISDTGSGESGFYLHDHEKLFSVLKNLQQQKKKAILFGVTYALLDFVSNHKLNFPELIVMETGGMKGKRREMVREEVHSLLCNGFGVKEIFSEYGMTELLSQAYSKGNGIFKPPTWMRVLIRDPYDPLITIGMDAINRVPTTTPTGGINIIDLANIDSCAFIATQDLGKVYYDKSFEVIGRFDFSDVRGCNLMVE